MSKKLYVGSLPYCIGKKELEKIFGECGTVLSAKVILDADTGLGKGFGFVEMSSSEEAAKAISQINGAAHGGRKLVVTISKTGSKDKRKSGGHGKSLGGRTTTNRLYGNREKRNTMA